MGKILAIAGKEVRTYFASPTAYLVTAVFLVLTGAFFASSLSGSLPEATVRGFIFPGGYILLLLSPVLTMRLLAEEQKLGTIELLLTAPVRDSEVVLGKFLGALAILVGMVALTLYYPLLLFWFGEPDPWPIATAYLGLLLVGASALAVGLLASSLTSNQVLAAVLGMGLLLLFALLDSLTQFVSGTPASVISYLSLLNHMQDLSWGIIDTRDIIYYLSLIAFFLFTTIRALEARRWR